MKWDEQKLDNLVSEMEERVRSGISQEEAEEVPEAECVAGVIGFWMMKVKNCRTE